MTTVTKLFPSGDYEVSDVVAGYLVHRRYSQYTKREALAAFRDEVWDSKTVHERSLKADALCPKCDSRSKLLQTGKHAAIDQCTNDRCAYTFQVIYT